MSTAFELLHGAKVYHLVYIQEGDGWKMAFNTPCWMLYLVMPFGITNAPAVFQALINDVLLICFVLFLEHILIISKTQEEHAHHIQSMLPLRLENSSRSGEK